MALIHNTRTHVDVLWGKVEQDRIILLPGLNEVDDAKWDKAKKNWTVAKRVDDGDYIEEDDGESSLEGIAVRKAADMVKNCGDIHLLKKWRHDKRVKIQKLVQKQIDFLTAPPPDPDEHVHM